MTNKSIYGIQKYLYEKRKDFDVMQALCSRSNAGIKKTSGHEN